MLQKSELPSPYGCIKGNLKTCSSSQPILSCLGSLVSTLHYRALALDLLLFFASHCKHDVSFTSSLCLSCPFFDLTGPLPFLMSVSKIQTHWEGVIKTGRSLFSTLQIISYRKGLIRMEKETIFSTYEVPDILHGSFQNPYNQHCNVVIMIPILNI